MAVLEDTVEDTVRQIDMEGRSFFDGLREVEEHMPIEDERMPRKEERHFWIHETSTRNGVKIYGVGDGTDLGVKLIVPFTQGAYLPGQLATGLWQLTQTEPALLRRIDVGVTDYLSVYYTKGEEGKAWEVGIDYWGWSGQNVISHGKDQDPTTYNLRAALRSKRARNNDADVEALQTWLSREAKLRKVPVTIRGDLIAFGKGSTIIDAKTLEEELHRPPQQLTFSSGRNQIVGPVTVKQESLTIQFGYGSPGKKYAALVEWLEKNMFALDRAVLVATGTSLVTELQTPWEVRYKRVVFDTYRYGR